MRRPRLRQLRPSPAMIVALLALFVATSGGAYAVATLGANTVGTKQLKSGAVTNAKLHGNAVTSAKVADGSLYAADFRAGQLQAGMNTLAAGHTERGAFSVGGPAYTPGSEFVSSVSFPITLAADLDSAHVVYVTAASATHCPGRGRADRGYLCLYEASTSSLSASPSVVKPTTDIVPAFGASREGFMLIATSVGTNPFVYAWGTWAVTG